jgi:hypothetical protein
LWAFILFIAARGWSVKPQVAMPKQQRAASEPHGTECGIKGHICHNTQCGHLPRAWCVMSESRSQPPQGYYLGKSQCPETAVVFLSFHDSDVER